MTFCLLSGLFFFCLVSCVYSGLLLLDDTECRLYTKSSMLLGFLSMEYEQVIPDRTKDMNLYGSIENSEVSGG